jgi:hypothetical protein
MPVAPEAVVSPPGVTPPPYSLIDSAVIVDEPEGVRWEGGFVFQPENCIESAVFPPCATTNEVDELCILSSTSGGTFTFTFGPDTTPPLAYNISAADLQFAIESLPSVGFGNVLVTDDTASAPGCLTRFRIEWISVLGETDVSASVSADGTLLVGTPGGLVFTPAVQAAGEDLMKSEYFDPTEDIFYEPFIVEVPFRCSSFGFQATEYERRAMRQLDAGKSKAIEFEFWTGQKISTNISLQRSTPNDDAHILNPGGAAAPMAVSPAIALVLLAQALANCGTGARGMIHATPGLVQRWTDLTSVTEEDHRLVTSGRRDIIVAGTGYPGTGPMGQPPPGPNEVWAYATGMVNLRLGDPEIIPGSFKEALDRRTNTVEYRGEMTAAAVHDGCCSFAVLVDICGSI